jgi:putative SOS response-associated peptidase YedK
MCATFRIDFGEDDETLREIARRIEERYGAERAAAIGKGDLFPKSEAPVVSKDGIGLLQWGFPLGSQPKVVFNARSETLLEKPMFRGSMERRCAVPATAFYEWDHRGARPARLRLRVEAHPMFYLAALWSRFRKEDGSLLHAFVLLTTAPNGLIAPIHDRMPAILLPEALDAWIAEGPTPEAALAAIAPFAGAMRMEPG